MASALKVVRCTIEVRRRTRNGVKKGLKVSTFIYRHLQGNPDQQRFTIEAAYWLAMTQVAQRK